MVRGASLTTTASWDTDGEKWTLPVGAQAGRLIKAFGNLPVNLPIAAYYNTLRPQGAGTWQLRPAPRLRSFSDIAAAAEHWRKR